MGVRSSHGTAIIGGEEATAVVDASVDADVEPLLQDGDEVCCRGDLSSGTVGEHHRHHLLLRMHERAKEDGSSCQTWFDDIVAADAGDEAAADDGGRCQGV